MCSEVVPPPLSSLVFLLFTLGLSLAQYCLRAYHYRGGKITLETLLYHFILAVHYLSSQFSLDGFMYKLLMVYFLPRPKTQCLTEVRALLEKFVDSCSYKQALRDESRSITLILVAG